MDEEEDNDIEEEEEEPTAEDLKAGEDEFDDI